MFAAMAVAVMTLTACGNDDDDRVNINPYSNLQGSVEDVTVVLNEGTNMAAAPSPDGQRIVFSAQGALWVIPIGGGDATRITSWTVEPTAPVWAPDGKTIAFQNYTPEGNYHIWTVEPDGANMQELTTGFFDDREPAWSADGSTLVFSSDRSQDGQYKIWTYTLAGGALKQVTTGAGAESNPVFSPDGQTIAFVDTNNIYTVAAAGGARTLVNAGITPAFAPSGALVYQTPARVLTVGGQAVSGTEDLFPFPVRYLADGRFMYTGDGKIIIRDGTGANPISVPFSASLAVRRPVLTKTKDHGFDNLGAQPITGVSSPVISPDGQSVAFVALNDVWVMKIGSAPVRLTDDIDRDGNPQWTRDGTAVYFSTERENAGALAIDKIDVTTLARTRLGAIAAKSMVTPMMSPAGDRIAYTTGAGQLELWNIASKSAEVIIPQVSRQVSTPYWTASGQRIVLVDNEAINNRFREGYNKLRVIDLVAKTGAFHQVAGAAAAGVGSRRRRRRAVARWNPTRVHHGFGTAGHADERRRHSCRRSQGDHHRGRRPAVMGRRFANHPLQVRVGAEDDSGRRQRCEGRAANPDVATEDRTRDDDRARREAVGREDRHAAVRHGHRHPSQSDNDDPAARCERRGRG